MTRHAHGAPADLDLAHSLADHADAITSRHFATGGVAWQTKSDGSPVTAVDREVELAVRTLINQARADDAFLGEEFGAQGHGRRRWTVDAIDGTAGFLAGEPEWGTLIALAEVTPSRSAWSPLRPARPGGGPHAAREPGARACR